MKKCSDGCRRLGIGGRLDTSNSFIRNRQATFQSSAWLNLMNGRTNLRIAVIGLMEIIPSNNDHPA